MKQRFLLGLLSLFVYFATSAIQAQRQGPRDEPPGMMDGPGQDGRRDFKRMARDLNLTKDQQEKAKAQREKREPGVRNQMDKLRPLHEDLRKLLEAEHVDLAKVREKLRAIGDVMIEIRMLQIQGRLDFESLLTDEQKSTLRKLHQKDMERHHDREPGPEGNR